MTSGKKYDTLAEQDNDKGQGDKKVSFKDKEVQGVALYLEFRKTHQTIQVIITPDGYDTNGTFVSAKFFRRLLTTAQPKKRWKAFNLNQRSLLKNKLEGGEVSDELMAELVAGRLDGIYDYMNSLVRGGYKLVKDKPLYIELSKEDFSSIRMGETPVKVINRIKSTRTAFGFPTEVIDLPAAV